MFKFNTIEEALEDLRQGKVVLCTDDPDRENEGDFICAAEFATTENVNFMAVHGKGLICMPMSIDLCKKLQFPQMVIENTDNHETAFTVSIDHVDTTTASPLKSAVLRRARWSTKMRSRSIFAGQGICFRSWQSRTACLSATATRKRRLISCVWQAFKSAASAVRSCAMMAR